MDDYTLKLRPEPSAISILGEIGDPLLTIMKDGTVSGTIEGASEAGRVFVDSLRKQFGLLDKAPEEDWLEEIISDSLDMDWRPRDGARAITRAWHERPLGEISDATFEEAMKSDAITQAIIQDICELDNNPFDGMGDDDVWCSLSDLQVILERNLEDHRTTSLAAQDGLLSLLREQHEAMAEVMQLRRMSKDQEQRNKAQAAIEVWRKVDAALASIEVNSDAD